MATWIISHANRDIRGDGDAAADTGRIAERARAHPEMPIDTNMSGRMSLCGQTIGGPISGHTRNSMSRIRQDSARHAARSAVAAPASLALPLEGRPLPVLRRERCNKKPPRANAGRLEFE